MLRISGLVRLATDTRQRLAHPITPRELQHLRERVETGLARVDEIVRRNGLTVADLPDPSRRACGFLKSIDWSKVSLAGADAPAPPRRIQLRWNRLTCFLEDTLQWLWDEPGDAAIQVQHAAISSMSRMIEDDISAHGGNDRVDLGRATADIRGWVAYFSDLANLQSYAVALARARAILAPAVRLHWTGRGVQVAFRPLDLIYRVKPVAGISQVALPTPMIAFGETEMRHVSRMIGNRGAPSRHAVVQAMESPAYQAVRLRLDELSGQHSPTSGLHHDLAACFDRVNAQYFRGLLPRPRLIWSRTITGRKMGHYSTIEDTVMISATLDHAAVPGFVLDYVMYHELLHKEMGVDRAAGRAHAHTAEFRAAERRFARHAEAEAALRNLSID